MNRKVSPKIASLVVVIALAVCGFVYSRLPTGMVVSLPVKGHGGMHRPLMPPNRALMARARLGAAKIAKKKPEIKLRQTKS